ncbi:hypothetical protein EST38_g5569 [Candolleomyces aberdarensis]|uniref:Extracellular metalloproteinase n=1 Tax=Candolleomyces aberdarensis TaxID=2316362 RepID=A0A4Q2DLV3_9AGAR|nr:hypothetical protein EST38_g5569 [Candolleomyces aberdarensis]
MAVSISLSKIFTTLLATILLSTVLSVVEAAPWPEYVKHSTHRVRHIGRGLKVEAFHPTTNFETFGSNGAVVAPSNNSLVASSLRETAMSYLETRGLTADDVAWKSGFTENGASYAYLKQSHNGIPFANAVCNIALQGDRVASWGSSLVDLSKANIADSEPTVSWRSVLPTIENQLDATYNGHNASLEYFVKSDGSIALTHVIQTQNAESDAWYEAYIDAHSGELISVTDFVAHATYTVVPVTKQTILDGLETLTDPQDPEASPEGWHTVGGAESTTTSGNNVVAFRGQQVSAQTSGDLNFNAEYDDSLNPNNRNNIAAATTNAFYIINSIHDVTYRYGFTEAAFNFQQDNFGKGGRAADRVQISVQDASGTNNANFATPPDGQPGVCRMFVWTLTDPNRDGTMENDIIIHEFAHGVTNRMTGGGTGRCLQTLESGGLGEGWGDALANWFAQNSEETVDFALGTYVTDSDAGIRRFPYSTSAQTNPLRYSNLRQFRQVHDIGQVWANALHNVYDALVQARGFSADKLTNPDGTEGNVVWLHLYIDALAIQPCNPTFVQARDAWIQADENRYNGANKCTLFRAFASRGLGLNADRTFNDDDTVPPEC